MKGGNSNGVEGIAMELSECIVRWFTVYRNKAEGSIKGSHIPPSRNTILCFQGGKCINWKRLYWKL